MSDSPSPYQRILKALPALYAGAIIAVSFWALMVWIRSHDTPPASLLAVDGTMTYLGRRLDVTLICDCPSYLIQRRARVLPFKVTVKVPSTEHLVIPTSAFTDDIDVSIGASAATVDPEAVNIGDGLDLVQSGQISRSFSLSVNSPDPALSHITFDFYSLAQPTKERHTLGSVEWRIESKSAAWTILEPYVYSAAIFAVIAGLYLWTDRRLRLAREQAEHRFNEAKSQADANPGQARFAWDLARVKLEAYFDRNLIQVNLVFWLAVWVMAIGFGFVLGGIVLFYRSPNEMKPALVAAISGIITQFIGATFMVIYRSTMAQANELNS